MKLLFLNTFYDPHFRGGAEVVIRDQVQGMRARGHQVIVLATGPQDGLREEEVDGVRVIRAGLANFYWPLAKDPKSALRRALWHLRDVYNPSMARIAAAIGREECPDIAIVNNLSGWSSAVWPALAGIGVPILQVLHDMYNLCPNSNMFVRGRVCTRQCLRCKCFRFTNKRLSQHVSGVVGVSRFILNAHLEMGYFSRARVKAPIHNARAIPPRPSSRFPRDGEVFVLGFIGTLCLAKGIEFLIRTVRKLADPRIRLLVAGSGDPGYVNRLRAMASPEVQFLGQVDATTFYPMIDLLVVPSIWNEPLGMVIPEAFSFGIPVLASRRGGIPEMVEHGRNGYLFDPGCPSELEALILRALTAPCELNNLAANALASSAQYLDVESWLSKYEGICEDIIGRGPV